jgi:hypothetical protein
MHEGEKTYLAAGGGASGGGRDELGGAAPGRGESGEGEVLGGDAAKVEMGRWVFGQVNSF